MGLPSLPFRSRSDAHRKDTATERNSFLKTQSLYKDDGKRRALPEILHLTPVPCRIRSPTESSISSVLSATIPDSATTRSVSSLASPISTTYGDCPDHFSSHSLDGSRPSSRFFHRHQPSNGSCSTFVNDEDDGAHPTGYSHLAFKLDPYYSFKPEVTTITEPPSPRQAKYSAVILIFSNPIHSLSGVVHVKEEEPVEPISITEPREEPTPVTSPKPQTNDWDSASTASEDFSAQDADTILGHTLQLVYGVDLQETSIPSSVSSQLVHKFVRDVSRHIWQCPTDTSNNTGMSSSSLTSTPSQGVSPGESQRGGKRKKLGKGEEDGDEFSDGEGVGSQAKRPRPSPKEDENLRLSCPFRKRNPHRFNVRDHHSCAMTYFPKFAELRYACIVFQTSPRLT